MTSPTDRPLLSGARGVLAGLAGTAAMTLSQTVEQRLSGRSGSTTPADGVATATGIAPKDEAARNRLNVVAHWAYGTGWGLARTLLDLAGERGPLATAAHLAAVLGAEQALTPALGLGKPTPAYGATATLTDLGHHLVYAVAAGTVYDALSGDRAAGWTRAA
ncbi:hypothetical protein [Actinomycetospora sp. TBRC 11914]|uniref:hypothetical protein n=1 Tax=Actinomycetospora sp. TBRC 11914 TaxID=2729387 RepID=UPI00145CB006|nr:hypothetical protein [Actinomycetospora sp. TBRC 11914]NMO90929.1 hypothetical protein [Actinomycetospora sp. TBRC 11914]